MRGGYHRFRAKPFLQKILYAIQKIRGNGKRRAVHRISCSGCQDGVSKEGARSGTPESISAGSAPAGTFEVEDGRDGEWCADDYGGHEEAAGDSGGARDRFAGVSRKAGWSEEDGILKGRGIAGQYRHAGITPWMVRLSGGGRMVEYSRKNRDYSGAEALS
ncbi:MAG: hypothetical protein PWP08_1246 [Methanofollis sp.]|nr:hypothetical protein [Methanofollis sp.]